MINEFEVKMSPESNWELRQINIYNDISFSNTHSKSSETHPHSFTSISKNSNLNFDIAQNEKYFVLSITNEKIDIKIRAISRIGLEYIIYHAMLNDPRDTGRPLTFYPHLGNCEAILDEENSKKNSYTGLFNLLLLCLFLTHLRFIFKNIKNIGLLLTPSYIGRIFVIENNIFVILTIGHVSMVTFFTYLIEHLASTNENFKKIYIMHCFNIAYLLFTPLFFHKLNLITPISGFVGLFIIAAFALKLISYAHFWYDVRRFIDNKKRLFVKDPEIKSLQGDVYKEIREVIDNYPNNITFSNLLEFLVMPVLCYQYKYPRTNRINRKNALFYFISFIICASLIFFIFVQIEIPIIENTFKDILQKNYFEILEKIGYLSIPNVYSWILMFYAFFHCWLNFLAEISFFADRTFYKDWWNSLYLDEYWRKWNIPTHYWLMRHVYNPLRRRNVSRFACVGLTFFVSGLLHEYVCSGALGCVNYWAFIGIFVNFPVSFMQNYIREQKKFEGIKNSQMWNLFFWISFCFIGQPLMFLIYSYQYYKISTKIE